MYRPGKFTVSLTSIDTSSQDILNYILKKEIEIAERDGKIIVWACSNDAENYLISLLKNEKAKLEKNFPVRYVKPAKNSKKKVMVTIDKLKDLDISNMTTTE